MKKPLVVSVIIAGVLLVWSIFTPAQPQDPANEEKPTFYRLTPGIYVNPWPRFTVSYPKDWVERPLAGGGLFAVSTPPGTPREEMESILVYGGPIPLPLDKYVDFMVPYFKRQATDVTVVSDKPARLLDGTPARELEIKMVMNGEPIIWLGVATKRGDFLVSANVGTHKGTIGEDLRAIPYSLQYEPGKDEPVKVPPDVQEFLDSWRTAIVSHDVAKVMTHYSDRYLDSGMKKGEIERFWRQVIGPITSVEVGITDFEAAGDRAYLAGFNSSYWGKNTLLGTSIIKESGEWKWYGNQRDVSP
jgi:hypothetical protein